MTWLVPVFVSLAAIAAAQTPATDPEKVVATIDGKKVTYGDVERYVRALPPQMQQNAMRDRKQFMQQYALMMRLLDLAETAKLDQKSPYKESLQNARRQILSQAEITETYNTLPITLEQQRKYYDDNKARYQQVKLKVIYIPFSSSSATADGKRPRTEEEAKATAEQLVKDIRGGADFVRLVRENSEDSTSKEKDGDFGTLSASDNIPEVIRSVVFALKAGEVSDPVRQPNGFYILRAESLSVKQFADVMNQVATELRQARLHEWMESTTKSISIKYEDEQFFSGSGTPAPTSLAPAK
jgi:peptidyl-prolyl cis-trans isomerase C